MPDHLITNFCVGPAKLYHGAKEFLINQLQEDLGELSHRSQEFSDISEATITALRKFFGVPEDYRIFYTYSATEAMEIVTRNGVDKKVCHVSNGNFGNVWANTSSKAGKQMQKLARHDGSSRVELDEILPNEGTEFLAITANETATGIAYSPAELAEIRKRSPDLLFGIDVTSSMGAVAYDFTQADAWFFSVQKAFGLPAGLGILFVGPRLMGKALAREKAGADIGCHHSLSDLDKKMTGKFQTPTTPNVLNIGGLGFICREFIKRFGISQVLYTETKRKAARLYEFFEAHPTIKPAIVSGRSESVIVVNGEATELSALHARLSESGIKVGKGYGDKKATQLRIANFPVHTMRDIESLLEKIGE